MKFGKSIGSQQDENVDLHYVDYKLLKKRIKDVVEQLQGKELDQALRANSDFDGDLEREIEQVNACFAGRQRELLEQTAALAGELQASEALLPADEEAQRPEDFRQLVSILGEVDQLRKYAVWNAVAVVKILKKRRKQTHFGLEDTAAERAAWLSRQSFFSGSDFAELHAAVESLGHMLVLSKLGPREGSGRPQVDLEREPQQCPICLDNISDMVELSCSHRFCWKCFVLGPIAFQPGEYRMTQCPICRTEATPALPGMLSGKASGMACTPASEGFLTRFLHTYFPKAGDDAQRQEGEETEEMRDVVSELMKALLADHTLQQPGKGGSAGDSEGNFAVGGSSSSCGDFFQTLPKKAEGQQLGAAQKLQWLQLASTGDSFALDGMMYCSLCSEPLLMEAVVTTPCKHHFHKICIGRIEEPKCPLCGLDLPFDWFLPKDHPCCEKGFRVVKTEDYRPLFPGGPSRGSCGYPLHAPPPVTLLGPGGSSMKSYLHKIVPMGGDEEDEEQSKLADEAAARKAASVRAAEASSLLQGQGEVSSSSESSSEDSGSEEDDRQAGEDSKHGRQCSWAYSALGRLRLLDPGDLPEDETGAPMTTLTMPGTSSASAASSDLGRGHSSVLLLGRHV